MAEKKKAICPVCNSVMNHHADKVYYSNAEEDSEFYDEIFGGILEEHYKCPQCGFCLAVMVKEDK